MPRSPVDPHKLAEEMDIEGKGTAQRIRDYAQFLLSDPMNVAGITPSVGKIQTIKALLKLKQPMNEIVQTVRMLSHVPDDIWEKIRGIGLFRHPSILTEQYQNLNLIPWRKFERPKGLGGQNATNQKTFLQDRISIAPSDTPNTFNPEAYHVLKHELAHTVGKNVFRDLFGKKDWMKMYRHWTPVANEAGADFVGEALAKRAGLPPGRYRNMYEHSLKREDLERKFDDQIRFSDPIAWYKYYLSRYLEEMPAWQKVLEEIKGGK